MAKLEWKQLLKYSQPEEKYYNYPLGWTLLVHNLINKLKLMKEDVIVYQIKEKFGGLRFSCSGSQEVQNLVRGAENDSFNICQECGLPGQLMIKNGWYSTVCARHQIYDTID